MTQWGESREIAEQVVAQEADYILALKANQSDLLEEVMDCFTQAEADAYHEGCHQAAETINKGHGRLEMRRLTVLTEPEYLTWLQAEQHWPGLRALGRVEAERHIGEERTREARSYLLSRVMSAETFGQAVRSHWGSENAVHWVLDVTFGEDQSRMRAGHAAENMAVLRHLVRNLLEREQSQPGRSLKGKRLKAGWDNDYLLKILTCIEMRLPWCPPLPDCPVPRPHATCWPASLLAWGRGSVPPARRPIGLSPRTRPAMAATSGCGVGLRLAPPHRADFENVFGRFKRTHPAF